MTIRCMLTAWVGGSGCHSARHRDVFQSSSRVRNECLVHCQQPHVLSRDLWIRISIWQSLQPRISDHHLQLSPVSPAWTAGMFTVWERLHTRLAAADGIDQYHDDVLDYEQFAVRVAQKDIPDLPQILNNIGTRERAELQRGLVELHRALMWGPAPFDAVRVAPERRGLAYNYTIESLRRSYRNFVIDRTLINRTAVVQPLSIVEA